MAQTLFTSVPFRVIIVVISYEMYILCHYGNVHGDSVILKKNK